MRNLILTFCFIMISLIVLSLFIGVQKTESKPTLTKKIPHMYENKDISIERISLTVFYFVPSDSVSKKKNDWVEITEPHLKKLLDFHNSQFESTSEISYTFFPQIILGEKNTTAYENLFEYDDKDAITPIKEELHRRVFDIKGDLHTFLDKKEIKDTRKVYLIIFEGSGAAGNDDFSLISRSYLDNEEYKETGSTFLAHEFYHTLGIPDFYKKSTYVYKDNQQVPISLVTKKDIMGQVNIPLSYTYIDIETLKKMGQ